MRCSSLSEAPSCVLHRDGGCIARSPQGAKADRLRAFQAPPGGPWCRDDHFLAATGLARAVFLLDDSIRFCFASENPGPSIGAGGSPPQPGEPTSRSTATTPTTSRDRDGRRFPAINGVISSACDNPGRGHRRRRVGRRSRDRSRDPARFNRRRRRDLAAGAGAQAHPDVPVDRILECLDAAVGHRGVGDPAVVGRGGLHDVPPAHVVHRAAGLVGRADGVEPVPPDAPLEPGVALVTPSSAQGIGPVCQLMALQAAVAWSPWRSRSAPGPRSSRRPWSRARPRTAGRWPPRPPAACCSCRR